MGHKVQAYTRSLWHLILLMEERHYSLSPLSAAGVSRLASPPAASRQRPGLLSVSVVDEEHYRYIAWAGSILLPHMCA